MNLFWATIAGTLTDSSTSWSLANASYDNVSFSVASEDGSPFNFYIKPDGTKMYVVGGANSNVYQYSLSTAWDLSTASYDSVSFSLSTQMTAPLSLFFKDDGAKMYITSNNDQNIYEYDLGTTWNVSTASYNGVSLNVGTEDSGNRGLFFKGDGTKMYTTGITNDNVYQYSLSTAWDLSTASYDSVSFGVSGQDGVPNDIFFKDDGTKMFLMGNSTDTVYQYSLSTAWDVSSLSYDNVSLSVTSEDSNPRSAFFKSDGTKMYMIGITNDSVYQYSL